MTYSKSALLKAAQAAREVREANEKAEALRASIPTPNAGINPSVHVDKENEKETIAAYKAMFGGKPGYKEPVINKDGSINLSFPNKGDAEKFFMAEAGKGHNMIIVDEKTKTVMGYSNGDGSLYHPDGTAFKSGDILMPSKIDSATFVLPKASLGPSM